MADIRHPHLETAGNAPRRGLLGRFGRTSCAYCKKNIPRTTRQKRYCNSTCRMRDWKDRQALPPQENLAGPRTRSEITGAIQSPSRLEEHARPLANCLAMCRLQWQPDGLPGRPDFANKRWRVVVFIHGCFLHGCPRHFRVPKIRSAFWISKIEHNRARDARWRRMYRAGGWRVITIWEHSITTMK